MSMIETIASVPAEHEKNVFGQFDQYMKKIERAFHVTVIARDGELKIIGDEALAKRAKGIFTQLLELSKRGNVIQEQDVNYAIRWPWKMTIPPWWHWMETASAIPSTENPLSQRP